MPNDIVWVRKSVVHWLLSGPHLDWLLLLHLLLLRKLVLMELILGRIELDRLLSFKIKIILDWILLLESLIGLRQLSTFINYHFDLVQICSKVL